MNEWRSLKRDLDFINYEDFEDPNYNVIRQQYQAMLDELSYSIFDLKCIKTL